MSAEDSDLQQSEMEEKALWQSECAAGPWHYYPELPTDGAEVLLCTGNECWTAKRKGDRYFDIDLLRWPVDSIWAWAYVQQPRKG